MKAAYFICTDAGKAKVAPLVYELLEKEGYLAEDAGFSFAGRKVSVYKNGGNEYYFAATDVSLCRDYTKYLPDLNKYFADCDMTAMVTWHEGEHAPDNVLTVHSLGDMASGNFGKASPRFMHNLLFGFEKNRKELGLDDYFVSTEATHWSGAYMDGDDPALLVQYPVPMVDIEVGSNPESWQNQTAVLALMRTLFNVFDDDGLKLHNILCIGGVHFEPSFGEAALASWDGQAFGVTHIMANQWLVSGAYENETGFERACKCVDAIDGGIEAIFIHDKLKGCYKDVARALAEKYEVPVFKHQKLREPAGLGL